jgi:phosphoribosylformylglycinamidine synthase subunit PurL
MKGNKEQSNLKIDQELIESHGLEKQEYEQILEILGREPNITELGIFSVMWSEHCSYKSTRFHLAKLHTKEDWVICGPGENAGIIDIEDDDAIIFKMESHNHPSFIEPYQGAATGVGGILRDVFTMGARPIAVLDSLRFGEINHPKTNHLISGVTAGIGGYGNCVGVPNISGDTIFDKSYNANILVNAMCVGHVKKDKIFYSAASKIGSSVLYVGAKTGRDGIHGATMASQEFSESSEEKRPTVQVGDPFKEKLLIEACLELMQENAILAIQDMGAAGLTSSSLEMCSKGGTGININLNKVPIREEGMTPYEMMLSESQERMLIIIESGKEEIAHKIFSKWELDCSEIGKITDSKRLVLEFDNKIVTDIPVEPLSDAAPKLQREFIKNEKFPIYKNNTSQDVNLVKSLTKLISDPDIASKNDIYQQYDFGVRNNTIKAHNLGAGIVKIDGKNKAIAATTDCNPHFVLSDPFNGAAQAVIECYRNLIVLAANPLAITNCLNFGNPEKPNIMGQIVDSIEGIAKASKELAFPVISGNVSLYNETNGEAILPTPNIGAVGLIKNIENITKNHFTNSGESIFIVGDNKGYLGASLYLRRVKNIEKSLMPEINFEQEKLNANFITNLLDQKLINTVNDISLGGLLVTITKMSLIKKVAFSVEKPKDLTITEEEFYFSEDQARYIISCKAENKTEIEKLAKDNNINIEEIGVTTNKEEIEFSKQKINISEIENLHRNIINIG